MIFFLFSLFLGLSQPILAWKESIMFFFFFLNFFPFFLEFSIPGRVGTRRNDFFLFSFSWHFPTYFGLKKAMMLFSNFLNCFAIFLAFSFPGRVETNQNDFFFLSFSAIPILFWLEKKLRWCFLIFWIFLLFFWNFLLWVV